MFRRIWNALNSYFGLPTMKELNVSIQPLSLFVLINNRHLFSVWFTATTGLFPVDWFIQNPVLLRKVARYKRTQSDIILCHFILPSAGNLTSTLVQNSICYSVGLLMRISFRVMIDHKWKRCNRLSVPEFDYWTSTFLNIGGFVFPIDLMLYHMWWFNS